MYASFNEIVEAVCAKKPKRTISVAQAADAKILEMVKEIKRLDMCDVILVGDEDKIREIADSIGLDLTQIDIVDVKVPENIGKYAVELVSSGKADVYVKGHMNTSDFLRSVLNKEVGLRSGRQLNVMTAYEEPGQPKLFFITDGGMNIAPTLEDKVEILTNAVPVLHAMGIKQPKVAILAANEKVNPKMQSTVDAAALVEMAEKGELPEGIYEGPIAFDVAMRPDAAAEKHIDSKVTGDVDLFLVPNIDTGNCLGKAIGYFGKGNTAGIVIGATAPVVMSSRAASVAGKVASVAWALMAVQDK